MKNETGPIDITHIPELLRLAEEVQVSKRPRVLQRGRVAVALLMPMPATPRHAKRDTPNAVDALQSSAGSWTGLVDARRLKEDIATARGSHRPDVSL